MVNRSALLPSITLGLLAAISATIVDAQAYDYPRHGYPEPERQPRRVPVPQPQEGGRVWGLLKTGVVGAVASYTFGQVYYRWKNQSIIKQYKKKAEKAKAQHQAKMEELLLQYGEVFQSLDVHAEMVDGMIEQLEQILQAPETDPSKRKLAEFKMPDANNDNLISRQEFVTYLKSYFAAHPELADLEYPVFEDFDLNADGMVTFPEWKEFITRLEKEQEKAQKDSVEIKGARRALA